MRWPIGLAKKLGDTTARYRWFAAAYLAIVFFILPAFVFVLSLAGQIALYSVVGPAVIVIAFASLINALQNYRFNLYSHIQNNL